MILLAFLAGLILDISWTLCVSSVARRRAIPAANWGLLIYLSSVVSTLVLIDRNIPACIAYAIGGWIGTFGATSWTMKR